MGRSSVEVTTMTVEEMNLPEATGMTTGDVEVAEVAEDLMTDAVAGTIEAELEDMIEVEVVEASIEAEPEAMIEADLEVEASIVSTTTEEAMIEEEVTTTIEVAAEAVVSTDSIEEMMIEEVDTTMIVAVLAVALIPSEEVDSIVEQHHHQARAEAFPPRNLQVPVAAE